MKRLGMLELDEDLEFQRREWLLERAGWAVLFAIVLAGLVGLLGSGPLSGAQTATVDGSIAVQYGRIIRWQSPQFLEVEFARDEPRQIRVAASLMRTWSVQQVTPTPKEVTSTREETIYTFHGRERGRVTVEYQARRIGAATGRLRFAGGREVVVRQVALP